MDPQFGGVSNIYRPRAIVQLPKIWKHSKSSTCRGDSSVLSATCEERGGAVAEL